MEIVAKVDEQNLELPLEPDHPVLGDLGGMELEPNTVRQVNVDSAVLAGDSAVAVCVHDDPAPALGACQGDWLRALFSDLRLICLPVGKEHLLR